MRAFPTPFGPCNPPLATIETSMSSARALASVVCPPSPAGASLRGATATSAANRPPPISPQAPLDPAPRSASLAARPKPSLGWNLFGTQRTRLRALEPLAQALHVLGVPNQGRRGTESVDLQPSYFSLSASARDGRSQSERAREAGGRESEGGSKEEQVHPHGSTRSESPSSHSMQQIEHFSPSRTPLSARASHKLNVRSDPTAFALAPRDTSPSASPVHAQVRYSRASRHTDGCEAPRLCSCARMRSVWVGWARGVCAHSVACTGRVGRVVWGECVRGRRAQAHERLVRVLRRGDGALALVVALALVGEQRRARRPERRAQRLIILLQNEAQQDVHHVCALRCI